MKVGGRESRFVMLSTVLIALILTVVPLPKWAALARPQFLVLAVIYWATMTPRAGGILLGWIAGLALDVLQGSVLGEHALALSFLAYLAVRANLMVRAKPLFEQSLFVLAALFLYEATLWLLDGWTGHPLSNALRWIHPVTGALLWPLVAGILGRTHAPR